jgi:hypothetical protein
MTQRIAAQTTSPRALASACFEATQAPRPKGAHAVHGGLHVRSQCLSSTGGFRALRGRAQFFPVHSLRCSLGPQEECPWRLSDVIPARMVSHTLRTWTLLPPDMERSIEQAASSITFTRSANGRFSDWHNGRSADQVESAILIISTPRLHCLRVSRMNSSRVLHNTPAVSAGVPSKAGYGSGDFVKFTFCALG